MENLSQRVWSPSTFPGSGFIILLASKRMLVFQHSFMTWPQYPFRPLYTYATISDCFVATWIVHPTTNRASVSFSANANMYTSDWTATISYCDASQTNEWACRCFNSFLPVQFSEKYLQENFGWRLEVQCVPPTAPDLLLMFYGCDVDVVQLPASLGLNSTTYWPYRGM